MISQEQAQEIKQKLIDHIEKTFPQDQKEKAKKQLEEMSLEQFEAFLEKNNIIKEDSDNCVFCSIISENIKSCKIAENEQAIAVLEINPITKGHSIIIPKDHNSPSKEKMFLLEKEVSKLLKKKLKATQVKVKEEALFGHTLLNLLPVYSNEDFDSPKKQASLEDLEIIKQEIEKVEKRVRKSSSPRKPRIEKIKEKLWLPKRIP